MRLKILLFSLLLFSVTQAFSQRYKQGYIILNDGTRLTGLVESKNITSLGNNIKYKQTLRIKPQVIPLSQVKKFVSGNKVFFKAFVKVDLSGNNQFSHVKKYSDFFSKDTIFLQVMFDGPKPLYRGYYNNKELFYISEAGKIELLEAPQIYMSDTVTDATVSRLVNRYNYHVNTGITTDQRTIIFETYKYQLASYLSDWPGIDDKLKDIAYNYYSLKYLFTRYYKFQEPTGANLQQISASEMGIFGGGLFEKVNITSSENMFYYLTKPDFAFSSSYFVGVFGQTNFKQTGYHLSLYYSLGYYNLYTKALTVKEFVPDKQLIYTYSSLNMTSVKIRLGGKYNFFTGPKTRISIFAGGSYNVPVKASNNVQDYGFVLSQSYVHSFEGFISPYQKNSYIRDEAGAFIGLSLQRGRFGLNAWTEITNGFLSPIRIIQRNNFYGITLSYSIIKSK